MSDFTLNRVLKYADYAVLGVDNRKAWEIQMALRALRTLGATGPDALLLGVGAAHEATIYHLTNEARFVFATDLYLAPGVWESWLPQQFLINPGQFRPPGLQCQPRRIIPQHADMLELPYEDNTFDGVFSSSSIEHVGTMQDIAKAAKEVGRVLKPGGIASLSTEWKLQGVGQGVDHVKMLDRHALQTFIVKPSGCEMTDELDTTFDRPLAEAYSQERAVITKTVPKMDACLFLQGYVFTSVHVALRKPGV